jgi:KDO2-lipid IV(A) lauroyltransferase
MTDPLSSFLARAGLTLSHTGTRIVPLSLATRVAVPIADVVAAIVADKRDVARRNYAHVLGRALDDPLVERTARDCFRHFGRYAAEVIHVQGWGSDSLLDRLEVRGGKHFAEAEAHGRGVLFVSGHMGSTEVGAAMAHLRGYQITSVAERIHPDWLMEYMIATRKRMGITLLPASRSGVSLLRALRRGGMVAFVVDAGVKGVPSVPVTFFSRDTLFPEGPARLARLSGAPLVFGVTVRLPGGRYRAYVCPPVVSQRNHEADADVREMTQRLATMFEGLVRRHPAQWYAFREMWPGYSVFASPRSRSSHSVMRSSKPRLPGR